MIVDREEFFSLLTQIFNANAMTDLLDDAKADKLYRLTVRLLEENKKYNLTAITDLPCRPAPFPTPSASWVMSRF